MEIPKFLLEMSEQLNTQDNRITSDPIWFVCYDDPQITEEGCHDYVEYSVSDGDYDVIYSTEKDSLCDRDYAINMLLERFPEFCEQWEKDNGESISEYDVNLEFDYGDHPDQIKPYYMKLKREVIKACLTEADANWFIRRKQHDYRQLYTYVHSMCYCPQMIELRNWIKSLAN